MTFASLFSGIGGADIAGIAAGFEHKFWCEIDPFCRKVLSYWFKNSEGYGDIKEADFRKWRGQINVLHGSTPCQSVSIAGKRRGDSDDRWLWREMLRAIREIRPAWVTFENVANIKNVVSSNEKPVMENGESYVMQEGLLYGIIEDLESEGYEVQSYLIPACAVGAPHERKRIWLVGYSANANGKLLESGNADREDERPVKEKPIELSGLPGNWEMFPTQSPVCGRDDGISFGLDPKAFPRWRKESIKALGNALVPQIIYEIYKSINEIENGKEE